MIPISEVIEQCAARLDFGAAVTSSRQVAQALTDAAAEIRALAAQYEGCIVAEGVSHAYIIVDRMERSSKEEARLAIDGWAPLMIPRYIVVRLYRAKEPK
jgi:hypothetical protein